MKFAKSYKSCATVVHNFVTVQSSSACLLSTFAHTHTRTNQLEQISFCSEIHAIQQNGEKGFVEAVPIKWQAKRRGFFSWPWCKT